MKRRITAVAGRGGVGPPNVPEFFQSIRLLAILPSRRSFPAVIHSESVSLAVASAVLAGDSTSFCVYQPSGRQGKQAGLSPASRPSAIVLVQQKPAIGQGARSGGKLKELSLYLSLDPESNRDLQRGPLAFGFRPAIMPLYYQGCACHSVRPYLPASCRMTSPP